MAQPLPAEHPPSALILDIIGDIAKPGETDRIIALGGTWIEYRIGAVERAEINAAGKRSGKCRRRRPWPSRPPAPERHRNDIGGFSPVLARNRIDEPRLPVRRSFRRRRQGENAIDFASFGKCIGIGSRRLIKRKAVPHRILPTGRLCLTQDDIDQILADAHRPAAA